MPLNSEPPYQSPSTGKAVESLSKILKNNPSPKTAELVMGLIAEAVISDSNLPDGHDSSDSSVVAPHVK